MTHATMKIEFNCAGTNLEAAFTEAIRLAKLLNVWITFDFNDIECHADANGSVTKGVDAYRQALDGKLKYKMAFA